MGESHTFIRGAKAPRIPLEAADQRSGAREAGRRIHRCWPASRGCQPAACGRHRLWNVTVGSVDAGMSHGAHPVRSLVDPTIEADLLAAGGVASSTFFAPVGWTDSGWTEVGQGLNNCPKVVCSVEGSVQGSVEVYQFAVMETAKWGYRTPGAR